VVVIRRPGVVGYVCSHPALCVDERVVHEPGCDRLVADGVAFLTAVLSS